MNKFYIQITLFLLSIFAYANNEAFAAETAPGQATNPKSRFATPEEVYEKNKHLLRTCKHCVRAPDVMNDAVKQLEYHATSKDGYEVYAQNPSDSMSYYVKKFDGKTDILKVNLNIYASSQYNDIVNRLWDPNGPNFFNKGTAKIVRVYNPNLVIIQQRYNKDSKGRQKYFYALVGKAEISKDKTIIAMTSANINDHNPSGKKYQNKIVQKANSFTTDINSEEDIKNGELEKVFVNIAGYLIEKKNRCADVTYVESIDGHSSIKRRPYPGLFCVCYYAHA
ncbi:fam-a protein [Plasmodium vinckei]|uniref:Fam-a protein n=1 Tax=Plasmodium vinckei TaxID=5860 RepID=A0A6V7SNW7_PLAVN|nr:fam-a protein [Plasmodium vinckei]